MTSRVRALAACGAVVCTLGLVSSSSRAQTLSSSQDLRRLAQRVMRDGVEDTMAPEVADGVGLGKRELPYKAIIAPQERRTHRDVAVIMIDGCTETRVDLCKEIVFGHVSNADYWALRATQAGDWSAGFVYRANRARVNRPMTKDDGEQKLTVEKAYWLAWLAR